MDEAGEDRRAPKPEDRHGREHRAPPRQQEQGERARGNEGLTDVHHPLVAQPVGYEPAREPPHRHPEEEKGRPQRADVVRQPFSDRDVAARPKRRRGLDRRIAEERRDHHRHALQPDRLPHGLPSRPRGTDFNGRDLLPLAAGGQKQQEDAGLDEGQDKVARVPRGAPGQAEAHDIGARRGAEAPHHVEPVRVFCPQVQRRKGIDRAEKKILAEPERNADDAEHRIGPTVRVPKEPQAYEDKTKGRDLVRPVFPDQAVGVDAGDDPAGGDDHVHVADEGERHAKVPVDDRPDGPQHGVLESRGGKCDEQYDQEIKRHVVSLSNHGCVVCSFGAADRAAAPERRTDFLPCADSKATALSPPAKPAGPLMIRCQAEAFRKSASAL